MSTLTRFSAAFFSILMSVAPAMADKFVCESIDGEASLTLVRSKNTQVPFSSMTLTDPTNNSFKVAEFCTQDGTLTNRGSAVVGLTDSNSHVVHDYKIGPFLLENIRAIVLDIDLSYIDPKGRASGYVVFVQRNGEYFSQDYDCQRVD